MHRKTMLTVAAASIALMFAATACTTTNAPDASPTMPPNLSSVAGSVATIPQPAVDDLAVADAAARVDLEVPSFSDPTSVTNPLFPVSAQHAVEFLGVVDGAPFRTEVTLLPWTETITWEGESIEALVSQYVAYGSGRLLEVAYDFYAQDDAGAVWYLGEDVFNFGDGVITDTHGSWRAGREGPPAMIMPADPQVGDVYRPENIPGFVFEEVTVTEIDVTLRGPLGPIAGGIRIEELHMDGSTETKTFAPGYGEFLTGGGGDREGLALAVPTDALDTPMPAEVTLLVDRAMTIARTGRVAPRAIGAMRSALNTMQHDTPDVMAADMQAAVARLAASARAGSLREVRQAALDLARLGQDLQLRWDPVDEISLARLGAWTVQLDIDADAGDRALVSGDLFALDYVRDRLVGSLTDGQAHAMHSGLERIQIAVDDGDLAGAARHARAMWRAIAS